MKCSKCETELPENAKFCLNCGEKSNPTYPDNIDSKKDHQEEIVPKNKDILEENSDPENESDQKYEKTIIEDIKEESFVKKTLSRLSFFWNKLDWFCKIEFIAGSITVVLFIIANIVGGFASKFFSFLAVIILLIAFFIYKEKIKVKENWVKYLLVAFSVLFTIISICSYPEKKSTSNNSYQETINVYTPLGAADCIGKHQTSIKNKLQSSGFTNISEEIINDLEMTQADRDGLIETISINGISDFAGNTEFKSSANVVITYHTFKKVCFPFSPEEIKSLDTETIIKTLTDTGFVVIDTTEKYDLDPDTNDAKFENQILVDGSEYFSKGEEIPINANIKITTHRPYEKFTLKLNIDFIPNIMFSTYDVYLEIDNYKEKLKHGKDADFEYRLTPGNYEITFRNVESASVYGKVDIDITENVNATYKICCYNDKILIENLHLKNSNTATENTNATQYIIETTVIVTEPVLKSDEAKSPLSCYYSGNYQDAVKKFKEAGFTDIKVIALYDLGTGFWDSTRLHNVEDITINDSSDFDEGDIFKKNAKIIITYRDYEIKDPSIEYKKYTVKKLVDDLNANAARAKENYTDQYIIVTGRIGTIDDNGDFIIYPTNSNFNITGVTCYLKTDEQKKQILDYSVDDTITVKGKVYLVDDWLGYNLEVYEII